MGTDHPPELLSDGMDDSLPRAVGGIDRAGVREVCSAGAVQGVYTLYPCTLYKQ